MVRKSNTFKDYIRKTFSVYAIAIVLLMFVLLIVSIFYSFKESIVHTNESLNHEFTSFILEEFKAYNVGMNALANEEVIQEAMSDQSNMSMVNERLYSFKNKRKLKSFFVLLNEDYDILTTNFYKDNKEKISEGNFLKSITNEIGNDGRNYIEGELILFEQNQRSQFLFGKAIIKDNEIKGYLLFFIENISNYFKNQGVDIILISDMYDNVIYTSNSSIINGMGKVNLNQNTAYMATINDNYYHVVSKQLDSYKINIVSLISINHYRQAIIIGTILILVVSVFIVLLIFLVSPKLIRRNLQSFASLLTSVEQIKEGDMNQRIEAKTFDEFQMINDKFNNMMSEIQLLINRNEEIAEKKRLVEIKHVENQFNPHFVFNVMEMLRYEILFDPENASNIVVTFANLMRYNINYGQSEVSLSKDIKYMQDYLALQKMRYDERLTYRINIDRELFKFKIPKLLIQPIIENCIKHGMEFTHRLTINISIRKIGEVMEITVEDDGPGIKSDRLEWLNEVLENSEVSTEHIGLYNAQRIIQLLYGEQYGLSIESTYGNGTRVFMNIPLIGDLDV